jgi:hypothetical protein
MRALNNCDHGSRGIFMSESIHQSFYQGCALRELAKRIVTGFMATQPDCRKAGRGMKQSEIFRACGFDWGQQHRSTSSNQQYWLVALLRSLEQEGAVEQVGESGPWRLTW